ncbi:MAG: diterpene synthase [Anaerolineae bacterium]|nr:diterpene synthase [Anaerolineae bacterium]
MEFETFQALPTAEIARLVQKAGPKTCVFPLKGTRRWFMLEYPEAQANDLETYLEAVTKRHIEIYQMIFDYGIDTLLTPSFDMPLMERGQAYMQMIVKGFAGLATRPDFLDFYDRYGVSVHFYGNYRKYLSATPYADLIESFIEVQNKTQTYSHHRIFFGMFVHDEVETIADLTISYYQKYGHTPSKRALIEAYYGEYIEPVNLFITFGKFRTFDMPLIATGKEDLYFTVSPSPCLTETQLRHILYDHLYARRRSNPDYSTMHAHDKQLMREFYQANLGKTLGIGDWHKQWNAWYPLPQVELPENFIHATSQEENESSSRNS